MVKSEERRQYGSRPSGIQGLQEGILHSRMYIGSLLTIVGQASTSSRTRERHSESTQQDQSREISGSGSRARRKAQGDSKERTDSTTRASENTLVKLRVGSGS